MAEPLGHDDDNPRLSLPFPARLLVLGGSGFAVGGALGAVQGARRAAQVFRAENTHRAPTTMRGWYFYRKTKNYRALHGGMAGGARLGARVAAWVGLFAVFEHAVDRLRRRTDALGSVVAGLGLSGCFALLHGFGYGLAVRTARKGLAMGVGYGLAQDAVRGLKGQGWGVLGGLGGALS